MRPDQLEELGLGLSRHEVDLVVASPSWLDAGRALAEDVRRSLGHHATDVQHIGSTSAPGTLCKPILDLAAVSAPGAGGSLVVEALEADGWRYRGDAGDQGGLVFVLEARPDHRVAHLHVVGPGDVQWMRYLALRDRLRTDPQARAAYGAVKRRLAAGHPTDQRAYTDGKDAIVAALRDGPVRAPPPRGTG